MAADTLAATCRDCHAPVSTDTAAALDALYGAYTTRVTDLADVLARYLDRTAGTDRTDDHILTCALGSWLGFEPVALVAAARHYSACPKGCAGCDDCDADE
jgi:hypothetical protein